MSIAAEWCTHHHSVDIMRVGAAMAIAFTLIETAKLNDIDPQAWFTWVIGRSADHKITRLNELPPGVTLPN